MDTLHSLEESSTETVASSDLALLKAWGKAANAARQAGFQNLGEGEGEGEGAYFEVQLV